jgi:ATP-dependent helicase HrpA
MDQDLTNCLLRDRYRLYRWQQRLSKKYTITDTAQRIAQEQFAQAVAQSRAIVDQRSRHRPTHIHYPDELPVVEQRDIIQQAITDHQVIIVCGATGSGKSTQLPKFCLELGRGLVGRIGHTQPRRLAARSLATRIAQELNTAVGTLVGYKVRFHDRVRPETSIKLVTDGMLLAEIQQDRRLNDYDTLIIDEAHERSLNIDFLLGYLKQLLPKRPDLKLIITSATIHPQHFAHHFTSTTQPAVPILDISGRTYPVTTRYRPPADDYASERDEAMQTAIVDAVYELASEGLGDILIFLSGEREIRETAETLRKHHPPSTTILPLYARQSPAEQALVFQEHAGRRIILATNVAETSLTVPGIRYVIDPGFARISRYSHRSQVQRLPIERISQASANQRQGRCGRVAAGICIRLYSEDHFLSRKVFTEPEIQRTNLAAVILQMKHLGFGAIEQFPFLDRPDQRLINDGYRTLEELAAIDKQGQVTPLGRQLARLPIDPRIGCMLLASIEHQCLRELLIITAALSIQDPRDRPVTQQQAADQLHATFHHESSDFLTWLHLWRFVMAERKALSKRKFQQFCQRHFLSWNRIQEWQDIHTQLRQQLLTMGYQEHQTDGTYEQIHRALLSGLLSHVGCKGEQHHYQGTRNRRFYIHPGSSLFKRSPRWVIAAEQIETTRHYGRIVAKIQPEWIEAAAHHVVQRHYFEPHWQPQSGQVAAFEKVTLFGLTIIPKRRVNFGPINPALAREIFLREALTQGQFETRAPFWRHNLELIATIHDLEAKSRRRDLLVDEEAIYTFYAAKIPDGIYSKPQFEQWLRQACRTQPKCLHMTMADIMQHDAAHITDEAFPNHCYIGATKLPLSYRFEPGHEQDGVTMTVPLALLKQVSTTQLDWLVPGLLTERIIALLRGLPKQWRKALIPIPDTAAALVRQITPTDRPLIHMLSDAIRTMTGVQIPSDAWDETVIPSHLRMKVQLLDETGQPLTCTDELTTLKRRYHRPDDQILAPFANTSLHQEGLTRWNFGTVPETVDLEHQGSRWRGYPALIDCGHCVALRVLDSETSAQLAWHSGLRRLIMLTLADELRHIRRLLPALDTMRLQYTKAPPRQFIHEQYDDIDPHATKLIDLADELLALIVDVTFINAQPPIRNQTAFEQRIKTNRSLLSNTAHAIYQHISTILTDYHQLRYQLANIHQKNWQRLLQDVTQQLDGLVFQGFLQCIPYEQLQHYPRYLKAIQHRVEKWLYDSKRDQQLLEQLTPWLDEWRNQMNSLDEKARNDLRLNEIRWILEELRVSLFAQSLGTAYPISFKRLQKRWHELGL